MVQKHATDSSAHLIPVIRKKTPTPKKMMLLETKVNLKQVVLQNDILNDNSEIYEGMKNYT